MIGFSPWVALVVSAVFIGVVFAIVDTMEDR